MVKLTRNFKKKIIFPSEARPVLFTEHIPVALNYSEENSSASWNWLEVSFRFYFIFTRIPKNISSGYDSSKCFFPLNTCLSVRCHMYLVQVEKLKRFRLSDAEWLFSIVSSSTDEREPVKSLRSEATHNRRPCEPTSGLKLSFNAGMSAVTSDNDCPWQDSHPDGESR